ARGTRRLGRAWVLDVCPAAYQSVTESWLAAEPGITVHSGTQVSRVAMSGGRVETLEADGRCGPSRIETDAVIDTTGTAAVVRLIDPALVHDDAHAAAGGVIFRLRGVEPAAREFPRNLQVVRALQRAAEEGTLPKSCRKAWLDRGIHEDEVFVKLLVALPVEARRRQHPGEIATEARATATAVVRFLTGLPGFTEARLTEAGEIGVRDGG